MRQPANGIASAVLAVALMVFALPVPVPAQDGLEQMRESFLQPPVDCRPHTRWWWMGNALSKEDITWQLEQMHEQGIGGVEQITMEDVFERGNHPYLSKEFFDLIVHAIREAKKRNMEFSLNFGGPGWIFGGEWVSKEDRNRNLLASFTDLEGPQHFSGRLPLDAKLNPDELELSLRRIRPEDELLAVVVGRVVDGRLRESSLIDLTSRLKDRQLTWEVPPGKWRLMAFWLVYNNEAPAVNHLSKAAMERYCDYLGSKFRAAFGSEFGKTVESFFSDSFEVPIYRNGLYWSPGLLEQFGARKGYALRRLLPALWWEVDDISPRIRYDVNEFLHEIGMEAFFRTFVGWCERNGISARIQPYGFVTDILEGAGASHVPEMEITAGEKDAVPWFDTRIGPRTYVASGAHLYGRNVVSVEAYTYLHWEPGRETLEELKIASDMFLRAGANKFYNAGYTATPEHDFVPARRFGAEIVLSPVNVWWSYYRLLSDYVARCSALLRYGRPVADIAVYSPLANQWTLDVLNARRWTRDFDWGELGKLILANGYDFDLLNDDVLLHHCDLSRGRIRVRDLEYKILILPNIHAMPLESLERVQEYARNGGVVIALEQVPAASTGMAHYRQRDAQVRAIARNMFREPKGPDDTGAYFYGRGRTYFIKKVIDRRDVLDWRSSVFDPFVNTLRAYVTPDFGIDFVREGIRENNGLVFTHRKMPPADIYFVTNVQDRPVDTRIAFRVTGRAPQEWNPYDGSIEPLHEYEELGKCTKVPLRLAPFESTIVVFAGPQSAPHVTYSDYLKVLRVDREGLEALAVRNGAHMATTGTTRQVAVVEGLPGPFEISGEWQLVLGGKEFPRVEKTLSRLDSWTNDPSTKHFSGTGRYTITFELPPSYVAEDIELQLSLGDIGNIGDVQLNGARAGVIWMRGQTLNVTRLVKPGRNSMVVLVTNTLINRVAGWKKTPPLPPELAVTYGRGRIDDSFTTQRLYGFGPLPLSGLLGPVRITPLKRVQMK
jgi:hypothetical protein